LLKIIDLPFVIWLIGCWYITGAHPCVIFILSMYAYYIIAYMYYTMKYPFTPEINMEFYITDKVSIFIIAYFSCIGGIALGLVCISIVPYLGECFFG